MRILYVAMTRAKEHLVLIGTTRPQTPPRWAARWSGHEGPLPADAVLGARSMLDWLGPVAAATAPPRGEVFRVTSYSAADVLTWRHPSRRQPEWTEAQARLARLEPSDPAPPRNAAADEVISRLTWSYPPRAYTGVPAALAVTAEAVKTGGQAALDPSALIAPDGAATPDEVGAATHLVLQHLDFARPCDWEDVTTQISGMVERGLLDARRAGHVDPDALAWLAVSELGRLLRLKAMTLRREIPIYASVPPVANGIPMPQSDDPLDRVMLRARLDVLLPLDGRCVLVDYKTDNVSADKVARRLELYRPQLRAYADAVGAMTGKPVQALAVFLGPRVICEV